MKHLPDLRISHHSLNITSVKYDLLRFAYKGIAGINGATLKFKYKEKYGQTIIKHRIPWLMKVKEECETFLYLGGSKKTIETRIQKFGQFIQHCDNYDLPLENGSDIENAYYDWSESLFRRVHLKELKPSSAYSISSHVSGVLSKVLNFPTKEILIQNTRLKDNRSAKKAVSKTADKQNLTETFKLGSFIYDICQGISKESLVGQLPIKIDIRNSVIEGNEIYLHGGLKPELDSVCSLSKEDIDRKYSHLTNQQKYTTLKNIRLYQNARKPNADLRKARRYSLFNLRISAEFMFFLAMTGLNVTQARELKRERFDLKPLGDMYQIRSFKKRKGGEVLFEIPKPYRSMFEEFLKFRDEFLEGKSDWLFATLSQRAIPAEIPRELLDSRIRNLAQKHGVPWIPGRQLRQTILNLLLRYSGDEELSAQLGSHTINTFRNSYELPSQQRALIEVTKFWNTNDPINNKDITVSVFNSPCNGKNISVENRPKDIVEPNCINPSGCLWCVNFRDEESFEYIWSLFSFRYLKMIEQGFQVSSSETSPELTIDRISEKINWFRNSNIKEHKSWIVEAEIRIEEAFFHPNWSKLIELFDGANK